MLSFNEDVLTCLSFVFISCLFLFILFIIKIQSEREKIIDRLVRFEDFPEQFHNAICAYAVAIILSYLYSLGSYYELDINRFFGNDLFSTLLILAKIIVPFCLTHLQNKHQNGTATCLDDLTGVIFYLCVIIDSFCFLAIYIVKLVFYLYKRRLYNDNGIASKCASTLVNIFFILVSIFIESIIPNRFIHFAFWKMLVFFSAMLFISEIALPPLGRKIANQIVDWFYC